MSRTCTDKKSCILVDKEKDTPQPTKVTECPEGENRHSADTSPAIIAGRKGSTMTTAITSTTGALVPTVTLEAMIQSFADYIDVKEETAKSYGVALRAFFGWANDNGVTVPVTREDILAYKSYLATPHPRRTKDGKLGSEITFSACTQGRYFRAVKLLFAWAEDMGIQKNVARNIKGAKAKQGNMYRDPLTKEGTIRVLNSIERDTETGKRDYALTCLGVYCGLRIIEMQRANVGNLEVMAGENVLFVQGKGHDGADDYVELNAKTYEAITDYLQCRGTVCATDPLFVSTSNRSRGERLSEPSVSQILKKRLKAAGYDSRRVTAHSGRHTSVTLLLESGATLQEASMHARHSSIQITTTYAHNLKKRDLHSAQRIENYLFGEDSDMEEQAADAFSRLSEEQKKQVLALMQSMVRSVAA